MKRFLAELWRLLLGLPLALLAPLILLGAAIAVLLTDLLAAIGRIASTNTPARMPALHAEACATSCVSVVIPNWNGRDLLEKYLPSVIAAVERHPGSELL